MSKIDLPVLGFGILCLTGGIILAYFGYFAPPYLLLFQGFPVSVVVLLMPFILIFLGAAGIYGGLGSTFTSEEKKTSKAMP